MPTKSDNEYRLRSEVDKYLARIKTGKSSPGDEKNYSDAYQELVKAGYAMQIKRKYRGR